MINVGGARALRMLAHAKDSTEVHAAAHPSAENSSHRAGWSAAPEEMSPDGPATATGIHSEARGKPGYENVGWLAWSHLVLYAEG